MGLALVETERPRCRRGLRRWGASVPSEVRSPAVGVAGDHGRGRPWRLKNVCAAARRRSAIASESRTGGAVTVVSRRPGGLRSPPLQQEPVRPRRGRGRCSAYQPWFPSESLQAGLAVPAQFAASPPAGGMRRGLGTIGETSLLVALWEAFERAMLRWQTRWSRHPSSTRSTPGSGSTSWAAARALGRSASVPASEWDGIAALGFDAVWLMGVWERSPAGIAIALANDEPDRELPARAARLRDRGTWSARPTASVSTRSLPSRWAVGARGGAGGARRARLGCSSTSCRTTSLPTTRGRRRIPNTSSRERRGPRARPASFLRGRRRRARKRPRPVLPRLARRRAVERVLARAAEAATARCSPSRAVRRRPLRHGDADDERHLRAHLGRARRAGARRRLLAERDPRGQGAHPTSSSSPRLTGISSGRCSSRASTTATTSASTIASPTTTAIGARPPAPPTSATSSGCCASSRTTTSRARGNFPREKARAAAVTALSQTGARLVHEGQLEGRTVQLPVFLAPSSRRAARPDLRAFYERLLGRLRDASSVTASGSSASAGLGGQRRWRDLWPGAGAARVPQARWS